MLYYLETAFQYHLLGNAPLIDSIGIEVSNAYNSLFYCDYTYAKMLDFSQTLNSVPKPEQIKLLFMQSPFLDKIIKRIQQLNETMAEQNEWLMLGQNHKPLSFDPEGFSDCMIENIKNHKWKHRSQREPAYSVQPLPPRHKAPLHAIQMHKIIMELVNSFALIYDYLPLKIPKVNSNLEETVFNIYDALVISIENCFETIPYLESELQLQSICIKLIHRLMVLNHQEFPRYLNGTVISSCIKFIEQYLDLLESDVEFENKSGIYRCTLILLFSFRQSEGEFQKCFGLEYLVVLRINSRPKVVLNRLDREIWRNLEFIHHKLSKI